MTGLLLPPDAALTPRPDTQTLRPPLSVNKLAALLPTPDVTEANTRNAGQAGNAAIQGRQAQTAGSAVPGSGPLGTTSTRETLSFAARTILDLFGRVEEGAPRANATLMPAPPTAARAAALPTALAALVGNSGLFYESHLAEWVNGARTLTAVRQEPQASLAKQDAAPDQSPGRPVALLPAPAARPDAAISPGSGADPGAAASGTTGSPADTLARALAMRAALPETQAEAIRGRPAEAHTTSSLRDASPADQGALAPRSLAHGPQTGIGPSATPQQGAQFYQAMARAGETPPAPVRTAEHQDNVLNSAPPGTAPAGPAVHPGAEGLVRQQLELLASQQFRWIGEAWPGTHMAWEITRESVEDEDARAGQAIQTWSTRLLLELPELGTVEARLSLTPGGLGARLVAGASGVAARFDDARGKLQERLAANGIELVQFVAGTGAPKASP